MTIDTIAKLVGIFQGVSVTAAAVVGAVFALYKLKKLRFRDIKMRVSLSTDVRRLPNGEALVHVGINVINSGNVAVFTAPPERSECRLEVKTVSEYSAAASFLGDDENLPELLSPINFLRDAEFETRYPGEPYIYEPGTSETVHVFFRTGYCGIALVKVRFFDRDGYMFTDSALVDLFTEAGTNHPIARSTLAKTASQSTAGDPS